MHGPEQIQIDRGGLLTFGAWDERVRQIPHEAGISIPDLQIEKQGATIRPNGEISYPLGAAKTKDKPAGSMSGTWHLTLPVVGRQILDENDPGTFSLDIPFTFELVAKAQPKKTYLPTPLEIRRSILWGIALVDAEGFLYPDESILRCIQAGIEYVEDVLQQKLCKETEDHDPEPLLISTDPALQGLDIQDEPYDFRANEQADWGFLQLRYRPVSEIVKLSIQLGNQPVFEFPKEWIVLYGEAGQIKILPANLAAVPVSAYGLLFPSVLASRAGGGMPGGLPGIIKATYKAGIIKLEDQIRTAIMDKASYDILNTASDSAIAGIASQSLSVDGLSQSISTTSSPTNSTYGANMLFLKKKLDEFEKWAAGKHRGVIFTVA